MSGVFAVARAIWDDGDFADEPFTEKQAMIWLVGAAAWRDTTVRINGTPVRVCRGEFCFAERFLSEKWGWTASRVHRFLKRLENRSITRSAKRSGATVYSLIKYNDFQVIWKPSEAACEALPEASPKQVRSKEEKHLKQDKLDISKEISLLVPPLDEEHAREVIAYRRKRKQSNSKIALTRLANQLSLYARPNEGAAEMVLRGWNGFKPAWMDSSRRATGPPRDDRDRVFKDMMAEAEERDGNRDRGFKTARAFGSG